MGPIRTILVAAFCIVVVNSVPVPKENFQSEALDQLVMAEGEKDLAFRSKRTIGILRQLFPEISQQDTNPESENRINEVGAAESSNNEVRVQFADDAATQATSEASEADLAPLDDIEEANDDENRNKRFLNFGFGASSGNGAGGGGGGGGSGAGSGNFLFDIIRLVAGSGGQAGQADGTSTAATATEAVPGPVTRLFVIANRGISNLIQDLILRLAATSERIVNFKARLITSII